MVSRGGPGPGVPVWLGAGLRPCRRPHEQNRPTDMTENITFPQIRWPAVKIAYSDAFYVRCFPLKKPWVPHCRHILESVHHTEMGLIISMTQDCHLFITLYILTQ